MELEELLKAFRCSASVVKWVAGRRNQRLVVHAVAHAQGSMTRVIVTASKRAGRPVAVHRCAAERFENDDSCVGPRPVLERAVQFRALNGGTVCPNQGPVRWEAQVLTERLVRKAREGDAAARAAVYGAELDGLGKLRGRTTLRRESTLWPRVLRALDVPASVRIRAVLETGEGVVVTRSVLVPPGPSVVERLRSVQLAVRAAG